MVMKMEFGEDAEPSEETSLAARLSKKTKTQAKEKGDKGALKSVTFESFLVFYVRVDLCSCFCDISFLFTLHLKATNLDCVYTFQALSAVMLSVKDIVPQRERMRMHFIKVFH